MIVARCPLRISLVGGSTDLHEFVEKYGRGSVINFTPSLCTYIMLNKSKTYRIICSKIEDVSDPLKITNDIAREVIRYFDLEPVKIIFDSDIKNTGSGLASSSSYLLSMIRAAADFTKTNLSILQINKIAVEIEKNFNPKTGYQDIYGCSIGGFKRLDFLRDGVTFKHLDCSVLSKFDMYLIDTSVNRSSTEILSSINLTKSKKLLKYVDELEKNVLNESELCDIINENWEQKKKTSPLILNEKVAELENILKSNTNVRAKKLCGAGAGGFFFVLTNRDCFDVPEGYESYKIEIDNEGLKSWII